MSQNISFNIYVMSYHRPDKIMTQDIFEYCTYVVREEEQELYRQAGVKNILAIPKGQANDFMTTLYWIINNTPEEVIFVADDDIKYMIYRLSENTPIMNDKTPDKETATAEVERIAQLIYDLNIGLAYDNPQAAPYAYDREFAFNGMPGHVRWINKKALKAKLNVKDPCSSDIDMAMQELLMNRIILLPKYFLANALMDLNAGAVEDRQAHIDLTHSMQNKWGKYYDYNYKKNIAKINVER